MSAANAALVFPVLTTAQISRIASHGLIRPITRGEVLIEGGQTNVPFFVVNAGEIEVIRPSGLGALLIAIVRANQFTGDISMILGRPAQMRLCASQSGEVVQLNHYRSGPDHSCLGVVAFHETHHTPSMARKLGFAARCSTLCGSVRPDGSVAAVMKSDPCAVIYQTKDRSRPTSCGVPYWGRASLSRVAAIAW